MTARKFITIGKNIPKSTSPISQAVVAGNYCHISGQLPIDAFGNFVSGTILEQTKLAFKNLFAVLFESGFAIEEIVFVDIAFINLNDIEVVNTIFDDLFPANRKPARTIYQAAALPMNARIKVMAIAIK